MNYKTIDISAWSRKIHYNFFKGFDEPFFGMVSHVIMDKSIEYVKKNNLSLFLFYLHKSIKAINKLDAFKYRSVNGEIRLYDEISASATLMKNDDHTFRYSHIPFRESYEDFAFIAKNEMARVQSAKELFPPVNEENAVHYSSIPWVEFSGLSHARNYKRNDSAPKISFGKMYDHWNGEKRMPVSLHAHHGFVDGYHVGKYFELFQQLLDTDQS